MAYTKEMRAAKAAAQAVAEAGQLGAETPQPSPLPAPAATVRMVRDPITCPPPYTADVHPDEVVNFGIDGWRVAD